MVKGSTVCGRERRREGSLPPAAEGAAQQSATTAATAGSFAPATAITEFIKETLTEAMPFKGNQPRADAAVAVGAAAAVATAVAAAGAAT